MSKAVNSDNLIQNNIFTIDYKDIEGRLDPLFYSLVVLGFLNKTKFPLMTIGHISENIKSGFAVGKEEQADEDEETKYIQIRPTNMTDNAELKFDKNIYVSENYVTDKPDQILEKNSVLFNNTNSQELVGKTCFFDLDGIYFSSNHVTRIKTKNSLVLPEYLCWILNYYQRRKVFFNICTNWNNQSGVNGELLKTIKIPVPPIDIQRKIVRKIQNSQASRQNSKNRSNSYLSNIDSYILEKLGITLPEEDDSLEKRIFTVDYREVFQNRLDPNFYHFFSVAAKKRISEKWNTKLFEMVQYSYRYPTFYDIKYKNNGYPVIKGENIDDFGFINTVQEFDYIDDETHNKFIKTELIENDLIFTVRGFIGKVGIFKGFKSKGNINANVLKIRIRPNHLPEFVMFFLNSKIGRLMIDSISTGQVQKTITVPEIMKIPIPRFSLKEQTEIVEHISELRKQAKEAEQQAEAEIEKTKAEIENIIFDN